MTIAYSTDWEIRTTGSYSNGGGFNRLATGTDYSQQDVAELSLTDCATSGVGSTTLTSVTGGFTAAMVGNVINLSSGTNLTANWYEITGYTDANTVTIDRAPDDGVGGVSGATGKVGGALSWPPPRPASGGPFTRYNKFWIKAGTYTLTNTTEGSANGPVFIDECSVEGYEYVRGDMGRKPVFSAGSQVPLLAVAIFRVSTAFAPSHLSNIKLDGVDNSRSWTGIQVSDYRIMVQHCEAINCNMGFAGNNNIIRFCKASYCVTGFASFESEFCVAHDCSSIGINVYINEALHCLVYNCPIGYYLNGGADVLRCIAHNCSTYGIYHYAGYNNSLENLVTNCGLGIFYRSTALSSDKNLLYNNTQSVAYNANNPADRYVSYDDTSITTDPYVDSANGNFSLNEDETGGQVARNAWSVSDSSDIYSIFYPKVFPQDTSITEVADGDYYYPFRHLVADSFHEDATEGTSEDFIQPRDLTARPVYRFEIGSGHSRDYSSLSDFLAAFDNTLVNIPKSRVIVTCYNDTGTDEAVIETTTNISFNPPSNCEELIVTVGDDSWHKGEFGKGCVIRASGGYTNLLSISNTSSKKIVLERLVIDGDAQSLTNSAQNLISTSNAPGLELRDLLIQGSDGTTYGPSSYGAAGIQISGNQLVYISNCIVRNIIASRAGNFRAYGMNIGNSSSVTNCTVYNITAPNSALTTKSIGISCNTGTAVSNSIVMQAVDGAALSAIVFTDVVTDDSTGTYQSTPAVEFVDAANGDFRLRSSSVSAGLGPQLTDKCEFEDITGRIRTRVPGVTTDIGPFNNIAGYDLDVVFPGEEEAVVAAGTNTSGLQAYPFRQWVSANFDSGTTRPTHPLRSS